MKQYKNAFWEKIIWAQRHMSKQSMSYMYVFTVMLCSWDYVVFMR